MTGSSWNARASDAERPVRSALVAIRTSPIRGQVWPKYDRTGGRGFRDTGRRARTASQGRVPCARNGFHRGEGCRPPRRRRAVGRDRKSTRLNSSHITISYAVFCLKKKKKKTKKKKEKKKKKKKKKK